MEIDPASLSRPERYRLLTSSLIPRPIAWVSTLDASGRANVAPYSFCGGVTSDPLTIMVSVGRRRGARKDTSRNLLETGEAVVHICDRPLAESMVGTSADVGPEVDEFELAKLEKAPSRTVQPCRIASAPVAFEARVVRHIEVGRTPVDVFFLEVGHVHVADRVLGDERPAARRLRAVGRLGGDEYCDVLEPFSIPRP